MRSSLVAASFALVALLALSFGAHAQNTPLPLEGYLDLADVADAHISPDGKRVVYMLRTVDKINDRRQSAMWLINADGSGAQSLGKGAGIGWAPDSRRIAYIAPGDDGTQAIFVLVGERLERSVRQRRRSGRHESLLCFA